MTKVSSFDELITLSHSSMPFKDCLFIDCTYYGVTDPVQSCNLA